MEKLLTSIYTDTSSPGGFAGVSALLEEARKHDPKVTREQVVDFLEGQRTYTLFKQRVNKYKRLQTVPSGYMTDVQVDLADFQPLAAHNDSFRYLLVGIDVLSRRIFGAPTKGKKAEHMIVAFDELFSQMPYLPWRLFSDAGTEFVEAKMREYFESKDVKHQRAFSDQKASLAERAIKSIKLRPHRHFSEKNDLRWIDAVPRVISALNHSKCRVTGMRPVDVNMQNWYPLWTRLYAHNFDKRSLKSERYKAGDQVRIEKEKGKFGRSYHPSFTDEVFTIKHARAGSPDTFKIMDREGEEIKGTWYAPNFSKTKKETTHRIVVHKERKRGSKKQYLVSWIDHDPKLQRWINAEDIVN